MSPLYTPGKLVLARQSVSSVTAYIQSTGIVSSGLVLFVDAATPLSYPGTGTTWTDLSGNGNNGTLVNGPTYSSANSGSIVFDGTDDSVNLGNTLNFTTENFTFNIFFYLTTTTTNFVGQGPILLFKGAFQEKGYYLQTNQTSPANVKFVTNQAGSVQETFSSQSLAVGAWNCVSVVRNGSSVTIYINGVNATATAATHINPTTSSDNFTLSRYFASAGTINIYANIRIAAFQVYNRALTATENQQNFNALKGRFGL